AWYKKNSDSTVHRVAQLLPNDWGLYDMHGNVLEWCLDSRIFPYPTTPVKDPRGHVGGRARAVRGGGRDSTAICCPWAYRFDTVADWRFTALGFRVLLQVPPGDVRTKGEK